MKHKLDLHNQIKLRAAGKSESNRQLLEKQDS